MHCSIGSALTYFCCNVWYWCVMGQKQWRRQDCRRGRDWHWNQKRLERDVSRTQEICGKLYGGTNGCRCDWLSRQFCFFRYFMRPCRLLFLSLLICFFLFAFPILSSCIVFKAKTEKRQSLLGGSSRLLKKISQKSSNTYAAYVSRVHDDDVQ